MVFCSKGDNITPPQQALDWILDLYADVDEIRAYGQTIVYTVHESVGHLGIFVSGGIAKKEHAEFSSNIDLIDVLPPGLYEATFEAKGTDTANADLAVGQWVMRCEARTLDDIRAMGGNSPEDERRFAAAKRVSEINLAAYQKFLQPWIKGMVKPQMAETMRNLHPLRLQYEAFSSRNPLMAVVKSLAERASEDRKQVSDRQSFHCLSGTGLQADRQCAGQLAGFAGGAQRGDLPCGLRLAGAAGGCRNRSAIDPVAPAGDVCCAP